MHACQISFRKIPCRILEHTQVEIPRYAHKVVLQVTFKEKKKKKKREGFRPSGSNLEGANEKNRAAERAAQQMPHYGLASS
jgi:ribosome assembly protein YihI (activator of Der GTPase)